MSFLGLLPFNAPYLPWILLLFSVILGNSYVVDLLGISVGHVYYYLMDVLPEISEIRGWKKRYVLAAPKLLKVMLGDDDIPIEAAGGRVLNAYVPDDIGGADPGNDLVEQEEEEEEGEEPREEPGASSSDEPFEPSSSEGLRRRRNRRESSTNGNDNSSIEEERAF